MLLKIDLFLNADYKKDNALLLLTLNDFNVYSEFNYLVSLIIKKENLRH